MFLFFFFSVSFFTISRCLKLIFPCTLPKPTEQYLLLSYGHKINFISGHTCKMNYSVGAHVCSGKVFCYSFSFLLRRSLRMETTTNNKKPSIISLFSTGSLSLDFHRIFTKGIESIYKLYTIAIADSFLTSSARDIVGN